MEQTAAPVGEARGLHYLGVNGPGLGPANTGSQYPQWVAWNRAAGASNCGRAGGFLALD